MGLRPVYILLFISISTFAQLSDSTDTFTKKQKLISPFNKVLTKGDKVTIKDGTTTLIEITNDGGGGSISFPGLASTLSGSKLYNYHGSLFWGTSQLGKAKSAGGWTDDGAAVHLSTSNDKVGIGIIGPLYKLHVLGDGNERAIFGSTSHSSGKAVYGEALNSGNGQNYGGYFSAKGNYGRGIYGSASGPHGYGVYGNATSTDIWNNYGGYFQAGGRIGYGVYGFATNTLSGPNFGGYFKANGENGKGVYGISTGLHGKGVVGYGSFAQTSYDFDAIGPGVNYGTTSSIRWKRNIVEIENPLQKLSELRGVYFDWDEEHGGGHDVGCIAEEVGKVLPEIVVYEENGIDADGMDYSKLTPLLIEVAKAQQSLIEELKKEIIKIKKDIHTVRFSKVSN